MNAHRSLIAPFVASLSFSAAAAAAPTTPTPKAPPSGGSSAATTSTTPAPAASPSAGSSAAPGASASGAAAPPAPAASSAPPNTLVERAPPPRAPARPGQVRPAPPPAGGPDVRLRFEPNDPDVSLLAVSGVTPVEYGYWSQPWGYPYGWGWGWGWRHRSYWYASGYSRVYTPVCNGPCDSTIEPGTYDVALAKEGRLVRVRRPLTITRDSVVRGEYVDHSGTRAAGIVVGVTGLVAGTVMMVASVDRDHFCDPSGCYAHDHVDGPLLGGGILVAVGSVVAGSILASVHDVARLSVAPLHVSSAPRPWNLAFDRAAPQGAALSFRYQ